MGKPIPAATATVMIDQYIDYVGKLDVPPNKKTQYVTFTVTEIMDWLKTVEPDADELKICLGIYPQGSADPGRVTVVIWPYKSDQPAGRPLTQGKDGGGGGGLDPYNDGNSGP